MKKAMYFIVAAFFVFIGFSTVLAADSDFLIRSKDKRDPRVYVVKDGVKRHIPSLEELRESYAGKRINNVSEKALSLYNGKFINGQAFKEGSLVRDLTKTIYVVGDNVLDRVLSFAELVKKYAGQVIKDVATVVEEKETTPQSDHGA